MPKFTFVHRCVSRPRYEVEAKDLPEAIKLYLERKQGINGPNSEEVELEELTDIYNGEIRLPDPVTAVATSIDDDHGWKDPLPLSMEEKVNNRIQAVIDALEKMKQKPKKEEK